MAPFPLFLGAALLTCSVDQLAKLVVLTRFDERGARWASWLAIRRVMNAKRGPTTLSRRSSLMALWACEFVVLVTLGRMGPAENGMALHVALGAVMGGATANLVDRLRLGAVVDFIDVRGWPVFNVADAAIVVGMLATAIAVAHVA